MVSRSRPCLAVWFVALLACGWGCSLTVADGQYTQEFDPWSIRKLLQDSDLSREDLGLLAGARDGDLEKVESFLGAGANVNVATKDQKFTPLILASRRNYTAIISTLLDNGADPDLQTRTNMTALWNAAFHGYKESTEVLLDEGAGIDIPNRNGATPLFVASQEGHLNTVQLLVTRNADVNASTQSGATPLLAAAQAGNLEIVQFLAERGADVNAQKGTSGQTALWSAAYLGYREVTGLLIGEGADVDVAASDGTTPAFAAAQQGNAAILLDLIAAGANVSLAREDGATPLHIASALGNVEVVDTLMEAGADKDMVDKQGLSALDVLKLNSVSVGPQAKELISQLLGGDGVEDISEPEQVVPETTNAPRGSQEFAGEEVRTLAVEPAEFGVADASSRESGNRMPGRVSGADVVTIAVPLTVVCFLCFVGVSYIAIRRHKVASKNSNTRKMILTDPIEDSIPSQDASLSSPLPPVQPIPPTPLSPYHLTEPRQAAPRDEPSTSGGPPDLEEPEEVVGIVHRNAMDRRRSEIVYVYGEDPSSSSEEKTWVRTWNWGSDDQPRQSESPPDRPGADGARVQEGEIDSGVSSRRSHRVALSTVTEEPPRTQWWRWFPFRVNKNEDAKEHGVRSQLMPMSPVTSTTSTRTSVASPVTVPAKTPKKVLRPDESGSVDVVVQEPLTTESDRSPGGPVPPLPRNLGIPVGFRMAGGGILDTSDNSDDENWNPAGLKMFEPRESRSRDAEDEMFFTASRVRRKNTSVSSTVASSTSGVRIRMTADEGAGTSAIGTKSRRSQRKLKILYKEERE